MNTYPQPESEPAAAVVGVGACLRVRIPFHLEAETELYGLVSASQPTTTVVRITHYCIVLHTSCGPCVYFMGEGKGEKTNKKKSDSNHINEGRLDGLAGRH